MNKQNNQKQTQHKKWHLYKPPPMEDHSNNFRKLLIVIIISFVFIAAELIGGIIANSISILSDAFHLITDLFGFILSFVFIWFSRKKPNQNMSFGYHRMEVMGALGNLFIIWALAGFLMLEAFARIVQKEFVKEPLAMLIVAAGGLPVNILMFFILHSGGSHSHGLMSEQCGEEFPIQDSDTSCGEIICENLECLINHEYMEHCHRNQQVHHHGLKVEINENNKVVRKNKKKEKNKQIQMDLGEEIFDKQCLATTLNKKQKETDDSRSHSKSHSHSHGHSHEHGHGHSHQNMSMKAAVIHALTDIIQSIGILISALFIFFAGSDMGHEVKEFNNWHLLDPISTLIFSVLVIASTIPITKNCYQIIMESAPRHIKIKELTEEFLEIKGVVDIHDLHIWDLRPGKTILIAHVFSEKDEEREVLRKLTQSCRRHKIYHSTFQVEEVEWKHHDQYILCQHDIH